MSHTYHVLTESEPFSEHSGGAISRWAANVLQQEHDSSVVAPSADRSWGFASSRVHEAPGLARYKQLMEKGGHYLPWSMRTGMIWHALKSNLEQVQSSDTVWVHNRPEIAAAVAPFVHHKGAHLFLHLHNSHLVQWANSVVRQANADAYIFVSDFLRREALAKYPNLRETHVLANGADGDLFKPAAEPVLNDKPVVLFASRLVPEKGLHVFLEALERLEQNGVQVQGVVVGGSGFGTSPDSEYLRSMRKRAPRNVRFDPYCSGRELAARFQMADIFCLPSCWDDPAPLAVMEALATGLPVVATRSGGIPEQLCFGGGILVPRNDAAQLAAALERLALDAELRAALREQALAAFQAHFTWSAVHRNYRHILGSLLPPTGIYASKAVVAC